MKNTQQAGISIALALATAMCWGTLPVVMKQVITPPWNLTRGSVSFFNGRYRAAAVGAAAAAFPLLLGNFVIFSTSLQYLNPTASQVIGQLSPVGV